MSKRLAKERKVTTETQTKFPCIDIGANLTNKKFRNDFDNVLQDAKEAGVTKIVLTGSSQKNSVQSSELCLKNSGYLYSTAGIHPHDASAYDVNTRTVLEELFLLPHVVAVGECGLDFNRDFSPRDQQRSCFAEHLEMAATTGLPMFLHERDAFDEFLKMMQEARDKISRAVVHCFTGTIEQAKAYLDLDLHLGITGWICDERRGKHLREVVKAIPVNRLMIETDAPYLAPRDYRPKINRNEPKYLPHILEVVAACRGENPEALSQDIIQTTDEFFDF